MFGRADIGGGGWASQKGPFCHKAHFDHASDFIKYDQQVRKYMRDHGCDIGEAICRVDEQWSSG